MELILARIGGTGVIDTLAKMGGTHSGKNGWNSLWQKWVELTMAKIVEVGVIETVAKMGGAHHGQIGGTCVIDTMTKVGGTHCGKNGWSSTWPK